MTLVYSDSDPNADPTAPATHVLIVGVERYDFLQDGVTPFADAAKWAIGQLTSPAPSAKLVADAFIADYENPAAPLGSVEMLVSSQAMTSYRPPRGAFANVDVALERASFSKLATHAFPSWYARCDANAGNIAIFYFCGHGFAVGMRAWLLLDSFGERPLKLLQDTLDFEVFADAMDECRARSQLFLIDSCRSETADLLAVTAHRQGAGGVVVQRQNRDVAGWDPRRSPRLYPTAPNRKAYGRDGEASYFAEAFVTTLRGAGWDDEEDPWQQWQMRTALLGERMEKVLALLAERDSVPMQTPFPDGPGDFRLHQPSAGRSPAVPVLLGCQPKGAGALVPVELRTPDGNLGPPLQLQDEDWIVPLGAARGYRLVVPGTGKEVTFNVRPPVARPPRVET